MNHIKKSVIDDGFFFEYLEHIFLLLLSLNGYQTIQHFVYYLLGINDVALLFYCR
jgi:hypothetical protein